MPFCCEPCPVNPSHATPTYEEAMGRLPDGVPMMEYLQFEGVTIEYHTPSCCQCEGVLTASHTEKQKTRSEA